MTRRRALASVAVAAALAAGLGGCISLFPKQPPAQLYTFGVGGGAIQPGGGPSFVVLNGPIGFDRMAATDRILTIEGNQVAYIAGARWASPAPLLFGSAEEQAFDAAGGARLVQSGDASRPDVALKIDVLRFEARYDQGMNAAPTILVRLNASLAREKDRTFLGDKVFEASVPASDNRVGAITQAFDAATTQVLGQMVTWVNQTGT